MAINISLFVIIMSFLMVAHNVNSATFNIPRDGDGYTNNIAFEGDAFGKNGVLQLTKINAYGNPLPNSAGRASYAAPVHLWDEKTGELAGFTTSFLFPVPPTSSELHGDGFSFFIAPFDSKIPQNATGGFLGLFSEDSTFNAYQNQIVAVEFDTYKNSWDPDSSHVGIDINSIVSTSTVPWNTAGYVNRKPSLAFATVSYEPATKSLGVLVKQVKEHGKNNSDVTTSLSFVVDLRIVLPEWVRVGFSGSTGQLVEEHKIYYWSFKSSLS